MKRIALTFLLAVLAAGFATADETRILLIGKERDHPPRTHEYMAVCELLAKCLQQTPGVTTIVSDGWPADPGDLKDLDAIVLYTANGGDVLFHPEHRQVAKRLLDDGVGLVALHWSTGATPGAAAEAFLDALGGWFWTDFSKLRVCEAELRRADPEHAIARGWQDYPLRDEYYIDLKFLPAARPVMTVEIDGQDHMVGWVHQRPGGGRSFGFVCGHFHDNFAIDAFRQAIVNGILWTAHREVPEDGAPCQVEPDDLELPPDPRVSE